MSIRLNKALRELNIGLQTAVDFLQKKSELGEVKAEPSFKINDAQYEALAKQFRDSDPVFHRNLLSNDFVVKNAFTLANGCDDFFFMLASHRFR